MGAYFASDYLLRNYAGSRANPEGSNTETYMQLAKEMLAPYAEQVRDLLSQPIQAGRPRRSLLLLAALYHDVGKPLTQTQDEKGRYHFHGHDKAGTDLMEKARMGTYARQGGDCISHIARQPAHAHSSF